MAVAAADAHAAGEEEDHEDGGDESVELVEVAAEVDELLLQAGDDGGVEAEGAGGVRRADALGDGGAGGGAAGGGLVGLGDLAEVFAAELAMHAPGVDGEEESGEGEDANERGDGSEDAALAVADDGGGGESGRKERGDGFECGE